ncbi:hypothetical protein GCM10023068_44000 [Leifsonia shinshuensis]
MAGQVDEPLDLDLDARPVETRLREVVAEAEHRGPVAAVQGLSGWGGRAVMGLLAGSAWWIRLYSPALAPAGQRSRVNGRKITR